MRVVKRGSERTKGTGLVRLRAVVGHAALLYRLGGSRAA